MRRKLFLFTMLLAFVAIVSSCRKEELISVNGIVYGKIIDPSTGNGLADVAITVEHTKIKGTTGTDGSFIVKGVPAGEYVMVFKKDGYLTFKRLVYIELSGASTKKKSEDADYQVIMGDCSMLPLTGKANGVVFNTNGTLCSSATVKVFFDDSTFVTTTDANGAFSFTTLPFIPNRSVYASAFSGDASGSDYDSYGSTNVKAIGFNIDLSQGSFKYLYGNFNKNFNNQNFNETSDIELYFSDNVDQAITLKKGSLKLYNQTMNEVGVDITVSGNKVVINPKSDLTKNTFYRVVGDVYASETKLASVNATFYTTLTTPIVPLDVTTKPALSMNAGKTTLTITLPTGALFINIYKAYGLTAEFTYKTSNYVGASTSYSYDISGDATSTRYFVKAEGEDSNGNTVYGAQSDIIIK